VRADQGSGSGANALLEVAQGTDRAGADPGHALRTERGDDVGGIRDVIVTSIPPTSVPARPRATVRVIAAAGARITATTPRANGASPLCDSGWAWSQGTLVLHQNVTDSDRNTRELGLATSQSGAGSDSRICGSRSRMARNVILPSARDNGAPMQKWIPWPKAM
jgi:hypothetical protein